MSSSPPLSAPAAGERSLTSAMRSQRCGDRRMRGGGGEASAGGPHAALAGQAPTLPRDKCSCVSCAAKLAKGWARSLGAAAPRRGLDGQPLAAAPPYPPSALKPELALMEYALTGDAVAIRAVVRSLREREGGEGVRLALNTQHDHEARARRLGRRVKRRGSGRRSPK